MKPPPGAIRVAFAATGHVQCVGFLGQLAQLGTAVDLGYYPVSAFLAGKPLYLLLLLPPSAWGSTERTSKFISFGRPGALPYTWVS